MSAVNTSSSPLATVAQFYRKYAHLLNKGQSLLLLIIRLTWGGMFMETGWGKWHTIPKVVGFFTNIGIPFPMANAYLVATTELVGGLFLALGLLGRLTPIPLIISMVVAYVTTEQDALHALWTGNSDPFFSAAPFLFLFASLLIFVFGPGVFSLDYLWLKKFAGEESKAADVTE